MYYESPEASVKWNDEVGVAILKWKKFAAGEAFRQPCRKALELAIAKGAKKWYSNTQLLGVLKDEDGKWFMDEIATKMIKHGIRKQALLVPTNVLSKLSLNRATTNIDKLGMETQYFDDKDKAVAWLKSIR